MSEQELKSLNVNEIRDMLSKYLGKQIYIKAVDVADISNQWHPQKLGVGVAGVLTIYYSERID